MAAKGQVKSTGKMRTNSTKDRKPRTNAGKQDQGQMTDSKLGPDIEQFLIASTDIRRLIGRDTRALSRKAKLSDRGLNILHVVNAGIDRPALLTEYFDVLPSTITADTDKLVSADLLKRLDVPGDRRAIRFALTKRGHAIRRQSVKALNKQFGERLEKIPVDDMQTCINVLKQIVRPMSPATPGLDHLDEEKPSKD